MPILDDEDTTQNDSYADDAEQAIVDYEEKMRVQEAENINRIGVLEEVMDMDDVDCQELPDGHEHDGKDRGEQHDAGTSGNPAYRR